MRYGRTSKAQGGAAAGPISSQPVRSPGADRRRTSQPRLRAWIILIGAAAAATACGPPMRWDRPGTDQATLDADSVECMSIARAQHRRLTEPPFLVPYFVHTHDRKGRLRSIPVVPWQQFGPPIWSPYAPWLANDQVVLRHELFERCLEGKGYTRVPDERGVGNVEDWAPSSEAGECGGAGDAAPVGSCPQVDATSWSESGTSASPAGEQAPTSPEDSAR